jgi:hypothetical protein
MMPQVMPETLQMTLLAPSNTLQLSYKHALFRPITKQKFQFKKQFKNLKKQFKVKLTPQFAQLILILKTSSSQLRVLLETQLLI